MTRNIPDPRWTDALGRIRKSVAPQQYEALFRPIAFRSFDDTTRTLVLQVPNSYVCEYIEENYVTLLGSVLREVYGQGIRLKYYVPNASKRGAAQTLESDGAEEASEGVPAAEARTAAAQAPAFDSQLNPHQTFTNYVEGESNHLSRSIGLTIAEHPAGSQWNPMFIYGPSGSGKTHLINAIGVRTRQLYPDKRVLYISARTFQVQYTGAVLQNAVNDFIRFYQAMDMLIVDDVQEWASATKTQDTFFHIFNHLFRNGRRIILASDRPPVELKGVNERLLTRFSCGLTAELERPNVQLCVDILNSKIRRDGLSIPPDVVQYIAETANGSVRDLQGVVNSLLAYSVVYNSRIDMRLAERVIRRAVKIDDKPLTIDDILEAVCAHFSVTQAAVAGKSRKRELVAARQLAMYFASKYTKMPATRIGKLVAGRDHSTVIHSVAQIEKRLKTEKAFAEQVKALEGGLRVKSVEC